MISKILPRTERLLNKVKLTTRPKPHIFRLWGRWVYFVPPNTYENISLTSKFVKTLNEKQRLTQTKPGDTSHSKN